MVPLESAIVATRNGEAEAFDRVVAVCQSYLRAFIVDLVHDENDVNDIAQETFVFAYQHLNQYETGTNFLVWLKAIARNEVMRHRLRTRRKRDSQRLFLADSKLQRAADPPPDGASDRISALDRCLEQLPEEQRTFLISVASRRSTLKEWSAEHNIPTDLRISRLYAVLRDSIERRLATERRS